MAARDSLTQGAAILRQLRSPGDALQSTILQAAVKAHGSETSVRFLQCPAQVKPEAPRKLSDCMLRLATSSKLARQQCQQAERRLEDLVHSSQRLGATDLCSGNVADPAAPTRVEAPSVAHEDGPSQALNNLEADVTCILEIAVALATYVEGMRLETELMACAASEFSLVVDAEDAEALQELLCIQPFVDPECMRCLSLYIE
jgi:hypothetical protein